MFCKNAFCFGVILFGLLVLIDVWNVTWLISSILIAGILGFWFTRKGCPFLYKQ